MPWLEQSETKIHYERFGEKGPWVTLVNGYTRSGADFKFLAKFLVSHGHQVLVLDNRGCGKTQCDAGFTLKDMAEDIIAIWQQENIDKSVLNQVEIQVKYEGYIDRQKKEISQINNNNSLSIPKNFDYSLLKGLSSEAFSNLQKVKPMNMSQASRLPGVTPAALSILLVFLKKNENKVNLKEKI